MLLCVAHKAQCVLIIAHCGFHCVRVDFQAASIGDPVERTIQQIEMAVPTWTLDALNPVGLFNLFRDSPEVYSMCAVQSVPFSRGKCITAQCLDYAYNHYPGCSGERTLCVACCPCYRTANGIDSASAQEADDVIMDWSEQYDDSAAMVPDRGLAMGLTDEVCQHAAPPIDAAVMALASYRKKLTTLFDYPVVEDGTNLARTVVCFGGFSRMKLGSADFIAVRDGKVADADVSLSGVSPKNQGGT